MQALLHPICLYRLVRYHRVSGLTFPNAVKSAINNLNRTQHLK